MSAPGDRRAPLPSRHPGGPGSHGRPGAPPPRPRRLGRAAAALTLAFAMLAVGTDVGTGPSAAVVPAGPVTAPRGAQAGFSPGGDIFNESDAELAKSLDAMVATGAQWVRFDFPWAAVEPTAPTLDLLGLVTLRSYDWSRVDRLVDAASARGLKVLALPYLTPAWARPPGTNDKHPPTDVAMYASFVGAAVARYAPKGVKVWEVWNEPNLSNFWSPKPDPLLYSALLQATSAAIRLADPGATILLGGMSPAIDAADGSQISPKTFLEQVYAFGAGPSFDGVAIHPYSYPARPLDPTTASWNTFYRLPLLRDVMVANGDSAKKVWSTEFGAPTGTSPQAISDAEQAAMVTDGYEAIASWDWHAPLLLYALRDAGTDPNDREQNFGLLRPDFSAKPSLSSFKAATGATAVPIDARYNALNPSRILDTRSGNGAPLAKLGAGASLDLQVTGRGGVPSSGVSAVVVNVTVASPDTASSLTTWPSGAPRPIASNLSYVAGQTVSNVVVAKVGSGGRLTFFNAAGSAHVIADVVGWYGDGTTTLGGRYNALNPSRILDTRSGNGAPAAKLGAGATLNLQVTGRGGVPSTGVSAVVLNVTATDPTAGSHLSVWPTGTARPNTSNLNFVKAQTVANLVVTKIGTGGKVSIYNNSGQTHVVADVVGWYGAGGASLGAVYTPVVPDRILDTRSGTGAPAAKLGAGASLDLQVTGRGGVPATGVTAVVLNLTATEPTAASHLTVWPTGQARPNASTLNFAAGRSVSNAVVVKVGTGGKVSIFNNGGQVHVFSEVVGWYS